MSDSNLSAGKNLLDQSSRRVAPNSHLASVIDCVYKETKHEKYLKTGTSMGARADLHQHDLVAGLLDRAA